jgi:hypothetical protein
MKEIENRESKNSNVKNMINFFNKSSAMDINRVTKSITQPFMPENTDTNVNMRKREDSFASYNSLSTIKSYNTNQTIESVPFKNEKDLDLPNFTATKYNSFQWKFFHVLIYFLFGVLSLVSSIFFITDNEKAYMILLLISHIFLFLYILLLWIHFRRGCIGSSNLNSAIKDNIDKSCKARILRTEEGLKYFFSLIGAMILLYGDIHYKALDRKEDADFWNINLIGWIIISLIQILKFEKILTETKQYVVRNDITNCLAEIFLFFGSLFFSTSFYIQVMYNHDVERFKILLIIINFIGSGLVLISSLMVFHRYFLSDYEDLNASDLSYVTIY